MNIVIIPNGPVLTARHYCLANALAARGHKVHYVLWELPYKLSLASFIRHFFTSLRPSQFSHNEFMVYKVARLPYFWPFINGWLFKAQIRTLTHRVRADVIFGATFTNETRMPKNIPFVYDLADDYAAPADVYGSLVYKLAFRLLGVRRTMELQCRRAQAVTVVSKILKNFAEQYNSNVSTLPNGAEAGLIAKAKQDTKTHCTNPHSIIYVTGFGQWSRPIETLQAVTELRRDFPDIQLTLVGKGSEVNKIRDYIREHNAQDYIHYLGFIGDRQELFDTMNAHAIGLNISDKNKWRDAAHPIKVIEYSCMGKKVVSTDLNEVLELRLPNVFTFSDKGKNTFKNALRKALTDTNTDGDYEEMRRDVLRAYDWDMLAEKLENILTSASQQPVCHVSPTFLPILGGLERVIDSLATFQSRQGRRVQVITSTAGGQLKDDPPFSVKRLSHIMFASTIFMPMLLPKLITLPRNSLLHVHVTQAFTPEMVWLASLIRGHKYIAHIHLDVRPQGFFGFMLDFYKRHILKHVLRSAERVVVFTEDQKSLMCEKYDLPTNKVAVVPNGVRDVFYFDARRSMHKKPRLLFVGRIEEQKNLPLLLKSLQGVSDQFNTTIIGDGLLRKEIETQAAELKLHNIKFAGRLDGKELLTSYKQADIFVLPSEREGMPLVLLEAMAMGLPVVATNVTGSRDVVNDDENGYLVPLDDVAAFRSALLKIGSDPQIFARMANASYVMAQDYSWDVISTRFNEMYKEVYAS